MTGSHKRKRVHSRADVGHEQNRSPRQSHLQARISELIERHKILDQQPGHSTSGRLMHGFIGHIWPEIRDDYSQMTQYLEEELKKALKERHIDAEVSSRIKEDTSIMKTLERREKGLLEHRGSGFNSYHDIIREMHDLSGLRIVLTNREHFNMAHKLIEDLYEQQKPPAYFDPNREVGQHWKKPWFGAYETRNYRMRLAHDNRANLGANDQYSGVMFEIQLTSFSDNLYNKLAHTLLYKADPGLVTEQEEMVIDVSHGLTRCFALCMKILRPKLHRDTDNLAVGTSEDVGAYTEEDIGMAQLAVEEFERGLHNQPDSDRIAQQLRKLLSKDEDAEDQACLQALVVSDPSDDKARIEHTKGGLLSKSCNWVLDDHDFRRWRENDQNQPLWITGAPGKGKTMLLCGIINELKEQSRTNVSYFFCQGTDERINTGTTALRSLLFLLCKQQHSLISHIRHKYDDLGGKLFDDPNATVALSQIFNNILKDSGLRRTYLVLDALDECLPESRQLLADFIFQTSKDYPTIKWIVSSRELDEFKKHLLEATHLSLESRGESISEAVNAYIDFKVTNLGVREQSPGVSNVKTLADELKEKSEGTFLWVALVCKVLESAHEYEVMEILQEMPTGLNELYGKLIQDIKALPRKRPTHCQSVLRAVAVAFRPLTLQELQELADLPKDVPVNDIARMCRSFLTVRDDTVSFVHQSAKDYLSNQWDIVFQLSMGHEHKSIFSKSLEAMERVLKQDIYNLGHPGISIEDIQPPSPDPLGPIRYSCVHWIIHFREIQPHSLRDKVEGFLKLHFLHWFEALSLIRSASACVHALRDLVNLGDKESRSEPLRHLASDMYRFAQSHGATIGNTPLQAYSSALIFSPASSLTRQLFTLKEPEWIVQKPRVDKHWNSCLATLIGHLDEVDSVAFSPTGHLIGSGDSEGTIKIWDVESGTDILTLCGHTDRIWSVAFDEEGKFITSESDDQTVRLWDVEAGACVSTRNGSREPSYEEFSSPNNRLHAKGILWGKLQIVDRVSNEVLLTIRDPAVAMAAAVVFSCHGRLIAYASGDLTVTVWDAVAGVEISRLKGHNDEIRSICFSSDGHRIASSSSDQTIKIWDIESSAKTPTPEDHYSHRDQVYSVALTVDGRRIASGSRDDTVNIWDAETGEHVRTLNCDLGDLIRVVTFSPDGCHLAVAADSGSFVVYDSESGDAVSTCDLPYNDDTQNLPEGTQNLPEGPFALSLGGRYIANRRKQIVNIQSSVDSKTVCKLRGRRGSVTFVAFSLKDCHVVAFASVDKTIKIWDVVIGAQISTVNVGTEIRLLKFDSTGAYLHTNSSCPHRDYTWSLKSTRSNTKLALPQLIQDDYGVDMSSSWITWRGQNVLWLPPEFRANYNLPMQSTFDVAPQMISVGCSSGRVWWIEFSSTHHPLTRAMLE